MKLLARTCLAAVALTLVAPPAYAAKRKTAKTTTKTREVKVEEVGILRNEDVRVVQKNLYVKKGHHEIGFLITTTPWDPYAVGVMAGFDATFNFTENIGLEVLAQGGYGFANGHYQDVTFLAQAAGGQVSSLSSDAVRPLAGGGLGIVWSPIYAKLAWGTRKVVHFDIFGTLGAHGGLNQQLDAGARLKGQVGPYAGVGMKFFLSPKVALKVDFRDNISIEKRTYTERVTARNHWQFGLGLTFYTGRDK